MADEEQKPKAEKARESAGRGVKDLDKELMDFTSSTVPAAQAKQEKPVAKRRAPARKKQVKQVVMSRGKRKEAIARARMTSGTGGVVVNGIRVDLLKPKEIRELILEPLKISKEARDLMQGSTVTIEVRGGGISGRAQAARSALAKTLVAVSGSEALKRQYMEYDRNLLVDDHRRVEPKKFLGPKARARFQTSYR